MLGAHIHPQLEAAAYPLPCSSSSVFWVCKKCAFLHVLCVSLLGSWSLAATLPADLDHPESQEVLVNREVCLHFGKGCLSGVECPLPTLAALACLSPAGDGPVRSLLALLSALFCERAWRCLRLGLFA